MGVLWGAGHALGTLFLSIPVLVLTRFVTLPSLAALGERAAGLALLATALWSFWRTRSVAQRGAADGRAPALVGLVHGVTGAGSLLLVLPVVVSGDAWRATWFLLAFALGSTFAMAGLTTVIGRAGERLEARVVRVVQCVRRSAASRVACHAQRQVRRCRSRARKRMRQSAPLSARPSLSAVAGSSPRRERILRLRLSDGG